MPSLSWLEPIFTAANAKIAPAFENLAKGLERTGTKVTPEMRKDYIGKIFNYSLEHDVKAGKSYGQAYAGRLAEFLDFEMAGTGKTKTIENLQFNTPTLVAKTPTPKDMSYSPVQVAKQKLGYGVTWRRPLDFMRSEVEKGEHHLGSESNMAIDKAAVETNKTASMRNLYAVMPEIKKIAKASGSWIPGVRSEFDKDFASAFDLYGPKLEPYFANLKKLEGVNTVIGSNRASVKAKAAAMSVKRDLEPIIEQQKQEIRTILDPLYIKHAQKSADVRVALMAAGKEYANVYTNPTVLPLITDTEKIAAAKFRTAFQKLEEAGKKANYNPAFFNPMQYGMATLKKLYMRQNPAMAAMVDKLIPMSFSEAKAHTGHFLYVPSAHEMMHRYFPTAVGMLNNKPYHDKWTKIAKAMSGRYPQVSKYISDTLAKDKVVVPEEKFADKLTAWQYADKLGLNFAPAFKHAFKFGEILARMPVATVKAIPQTVKSVLTAAHITNPNDYHKIAQLMLAHRELWRGAQGLPPEANAFSRLVFNRLMAGPVAATEAVERAVTLYGTIIKAADNKMNPYDWLRFFYDSELNLNFMSNVDKLPFMNSGWSRFATMFWYTPTRILTRNLRDVVYGLIPYAQYQEMAGGLHKATWGMRKDAFGTPYWRHLAGKIAWIGSAEALARYYDTSIWKIAAMHLPWMREYAGGYDVQYPIGIQSGQEYLKSLPPGTSPVGLSYDHYHAFIHSMESWIRFHGIEKLKRVWAGQIPEIYKSPQGSHAARYLLGAPSIAKEHELKEKYAPGIEKKQSYKERQRHRQRENQVFGPVFNWAEDLLKRK